MNRTAVRLALVACVLGTSWLVAQPKEQPRKFALLIGVNNYDGTGLVSLSHSVRDMEAMEKALKAQTFEVKLLANRDATRARIDAELADLLKKRRVGDLVLVAISGHGVQTRTKGGEEDAFFCPAECDKSDPATMLSLSAMIQQLGNKGANLVLVDACRDDPNRGARGIVGDTLRGTLQANTAVMFSCAAGQSSFETNRMFGKEAIEGHGIFFYHVLKGLKEAKNDRGEVNWSRLVEFVIDNVNDKAKEWIDDRATQRAKDLGVTMRELEFQTPHTLGNLRQIPVLAMATPNAPPASPSPAPRPAAPTGQRPPLVDSSREALTPQRVAELQKQWADYLGVKVELEMGTGADKMTFVLVPPGKFMMGTDSGDSDEAPAHEVTISKPMFVSKYETTKGQFARFVRETTHESDAEQSGNGSKLIDPRYTGIAPTTYSWRWPGYEQADSHPVVNVSCDDAIKYCRWLNRATDRPEFVSSVGLPTEAEWEYVCRAGSTTKYYSGDSKADLVRVANVADASFAKAMGRGSFSEDDGHAFTSPVGSFAPNALAIYDTLGNVSEWCADAKRPYSATPVTDPRGEGTDATVRGGWFDYAVANVRCTFRSGNIATTAVDHDRGFRVVLRLK